MRSSSSRIAKQNAVIVGLLIVPPIAGAGYLIWSLHHPHPKVRSPVALDRNSLLPHAYAGPCLNCHRIIEAGPVAMNRDNMTSFDLTAAEQRLLVAGQRVVVPDLSLQVRIPAITRSDPLPHPFVGVCSNCHVVLDVKPTNTWMRAALRRAYQPLATMGLRDDQVARGGGERDVERAMLRRTWGYIAAATAVIGTVYVAMRVLARVMPDVFRGAFRLKPWLFVHECAFTVFCAATVIHWHYSAKGNNLLHIALLLVLWLTAAGFVLRYRIGASRARSGVQLVHTQRFLFLALILLILLGHLAAKFQ